MDTTTITRECSNCPEWVNRYAKEGGDGDDKD